MTDNLPLREERASKFLRMLLDTSSPSESESALRMLRVQLRDRPEPSIVCGDDETVLGRALRDLENLRKENAALKAKIRGDLPETEPQRSSRRQRARTPTRATTEWSDSQLTELFRLKEAETPIPTIARLLNKTEGQVKGRLYNAPQSSGYEVAAGTTVQFHGPMSRDELKLLCKEIGAVVHRQIGPNALAKHVEGHQGLALLARNVCTSLSRQHVRQMVNDPSLVPADLAQRWRDIYWEYKRTGRLPEPIKHAHPGPKRRRV